MNSVFQVGVNPLPEFMPIGAMPAEERQIREEAITLAARKAIEIEYLKAIAALEKKEDERTTKEELTILCVVLVCFIVGMLLIPVAGLIAGVLIGVIGFACCEYQRRVRLERGREEIDERFDAAFERLKKLIEQEWSKTHPVQQ